VDNIVGIAMAIYCFIDLETTGISQTRNGIIQIGGQVCRGEATGLTLLKEFEFTVAPFPQDLVEDEALQVSGITRDQIAGFEPPAAVHKRLTDLFGEFCNRFDRKDKMVFAGYNAPFDHGFLRKWFDKIGDKYFGSWFWHPPVDVMTLAMVHLAGVRHELPDFKLGTIAARLEVPVEGLHTALHDARVTRAVFEKVTFRG
jgi:DNA polymerase-3 subunit epsilon